MIVCQYNAVDLPSLVSLRMFMLLLAVFNGELFVYSGVLRRPPRVGIQWMDHRL